VKVEGTKAFPVDFRRAFPTCFVLSKNYLVSVSFHVSVRGKVPCHCLHSPGS
jgi:hypothetical protein